MKTKKFIVVLCLALAALPMFAQYSGTRTLRSETGSVPIRKFSVNTTWLSFANFGAEKTNTHHYELQVKYKLSPKDKIGIKVATWKLFAPMGMPMSEQLEFDEANFYPGRLRETGLGVTYQRFLWKGLFAQAEIMPMLKTYLNPDSQTIGHGFKLYTTWHLGYHIPLFNDRFFIEPQFHCNYWPADTKAPAGFNEKDSKWDNFFLFEPNLYIGINL
jgi:hypothetical protein